LWDEEYIFELVKAGKLDGYAFEGDNSNDIASYAGNILPLPPMAWYTQDSLNSLMDIWVKNMLSTTTNNPSNLVV
jgi:lactate dehydrogenase-like 2-hydroxyacid dehydrogenase